MVGFSDASHCDDCGSCEPECLLAEEDDLTEECTTGFAIVGGKWKTTVSGAFLHTLIDTEDPFAVKAYISVEWNTAHPNFNTVGHITTATLIIIGAMDDCDSYWYASTKVIWTPTGTFSVGIQTHERKLFIKNNGVDTQIGNCDYNGGAISVGGFPTMGLCWNGTNLYYSFSSTPSISDGNFVGPLLQANNIPAPYGGKIGIAVLFENYVNSITIEDLVLVRALPIDETLPNFCTHCLNNCCNGTSPLTLTLELTASGSTFTTTNCPGPIDCSSILGTFTVPLGGAYFGTPWGPFETSYLFGPNVGDGMCQWEKDFNSPTGQICVGTLVKFRIIIRVEPPLVGGLPDWNSSDRKIIIIVRHLNGGAGNPQIIAAFSAVLTDTVCEEWDDWIDVPKDTTILNSQCNNSSTIAARVKK